MKSNELQKLKLPQFKVLSKNSPVNTSKFKQYESYSISHTVFYKIFRPGLTVITVNKMHHTRLFCEDEKDCVGKSQNIPAGTVVDSNIVLRDRYDFYLNSAQGIQGTSRPTHYTLIHDDNGLSADSLQMLTWQLCHGYARCTRSGKIKRLYSNQFQYNILVSIPVPTYYAELDRERASRHLYESVSTILQ